MGWSGFIVTGVLAAGVIVSKALGTGAVASFARNDERSRLAEASGVDAVKTAAIEARAAMDLLWAVGYLVAETVLGMGLLLAVSR